MKRRIKHQRKKKPLKQPTKQPVDPGLPRINARKLAALFGVSAQTVTNWLDEGMPAIHRPGKSGAEVLLDLGQCCQWILAHTAEAPPDSELGRARVRFETARATRVEMQNALQSRKVVLLSYVSEIMNEIAADLGARLDAIAGRCANEFAGITDAALLRQRLLEEHRSVRRGCAEHIEKIANTPPAGEASS